jgi:hypothetical protein
VTPVRIDSAEAVTVTCRSGDFSESATGQSYPLTVSSVLADAAMHAMVSGHTVEEHFTRDGTVHPA